MRALATWFKLIFLLAVLFSFFRHAPIGLGLGLLAFYLWDRRRKLAGLRRPGGSILRS